MKETTLPGRLTEEKYFYRSPKGSRLTKEAAIEILTYFFILLFAYASLRKLVDLNMFVKEVWGFALFGSKLAIKIEFIFLLATEITVAILLALPRTRLIGWYGTFVLIIGINITMFYMQQFSKIIPIYYGGIIPGVTFIVHFIFNIAMLFLALIGLLLIISPGSKQ